jgi:hypothetical protein
MKPQIILSVSHVSQRIGVDRRTALRRMERANIMPDFISVSGEWYFAQATAEELCFRLAELGEPEPVTAAQEVH